jgi:hypothetical protein
VNKRLAGKALKVLGIDISKNKLVEKLGVDNELLEQAESEQFELQEERIKKKRMNDAMMNKKSAQKALKVLGHDPSENKVENKLGVNKNILHSQSAFHPSTGFIASPVIFGVLAAVLAAVVYYSGRWL